METGGNCDDNSMCDIENGFSCKTSNEEDHVLAQWSAVYAFEEAKGKQFGT